MPRRILLGLAVPLVLVAGAGALLAFSPYRRHAPDEPAELRESVDVAAPCERLFTYLGNSANASDWSVFVDHITPLNPERVPDSDVGSVRRSYRRADETGMRWDERFTHVEAPRRRRLVIYNMIDEPMPSSEVLSTEQRYDALGPDRCRLTFTFAFRDSPPRWEEIKMRIASYGVAWIFRRNLGNIKRLNEQRGAPGRADA